MTTPLSVCVVGAGAIGGSMAVRMARAGARVSVVARGAHGQAIRDTGLTLQSGTSGETVRLPCFDQPAGIAPHDVVVVAVKAAALPAVAPALPALLAPGGLIVFAMNGIPWWFDAGWPMPLPERLRAALDPGGVLGRSIAPQTIVGAVVQSSNELIAPGVVLNSTPERNRMILGRPDGSADPLLDRFAALLNAGGYSAKVSPHIRDEIWTKTLLAASAGPVAALTGATLGALADDADTRAVLAGVMREGAAVGHALGFTITDDIDARLAFYRGKPVRPSMLVDFEAGRDAEIENSILAIADIAVALDIGVPVTRTVAALVRMKKAQLASNPSRPVAGFAS